MLQQTCEGGYSQGWAEPNMPSLQCPDRPKVAQQGKMGPRG